MYTHLKERQYYEDIYDRHTVEWARRDIIHYDNFYDEVKTNLPKGEKLDQPGNAFILNLFYMQIVGNDLLRRYEERESDITAWMARDRTKDEQIAAARLADEPTCRYCGKRGLRLIDKTLLHRGDHYDSDEPQEVLFTLSCLHCQKNTPVWQDGNVWEPNPILCSKCKSEMTEKTTRSKKALTFTYRCPSCTYSYKEKSDFQCLARYLHEQDKLAALLIPNRGKFSALLKFDFLKPYHRFVSDLQAKLEYKSIKKKNHRKDKHLKGKSSIGDTLNIAKKSQNVNRPERKREKK